MITREQIYNLAKKNKINETIIFREYLQVLFLSVFYSFEQSQNVFFKGGTAIHLIFKAPRFSEDLDFTVNMPEKEFLGFIGNVFKDFSDREEAVFKEKKTIAGRRFLLTSGTGALGYKTFVNLDFSFREKVLEPQKTIIETEYPVLFTAYVHHISKNEMLAEKIRAAMTRERGRDLYDLWFLLSQNAEFDAELTREKLKHYNLDKISGREILKRINKFSEKEFILDIRPFIPYGQRENLKDLFAFVIDFLNNKLGKNY
jgi:predicted nucleotidyltransferase component of viral defense system